MEKRWEVDVILLDGSMETHEVEELYELQPLLERGHDWNLIDHIEIRYTRRIQDTRRISSDDPNLQNIPIRTEEGRRLRDGLIDALRKGFPIRR